MKLNFLNLSLVIIIGLFFIFNIEVKSSQASELPFKLRGQFLIQVENLGQAWYVDLSNGAKHKIDKPLSGQNFLTQFGIGISNADLAKIPIAIDDRFIVKDSDGDGLDDRLEKVIGTDPYNPDTDGDGYPDGLEIKNHYNPLGSGKLPIDFKFSSSLAGNILLQVESNGEAWYVNPKNNFRYYIPDGEALFKVIRYLGIGISNNNLEKLVNGELIEPGMTKNLKIDVGPKQRLYYYLDDVLLGSFPVSAGKALTPTPRGEFTIINKHPKAWSPFGLWMPYWLGLGTGRFGIHELPIWPSGYREGQNHLGIPVSHGCIRLGIGPAQYIYNWVKVGTPVIIY